MNLLFIILATLGAGAVCLYLPAPTWCKCSAFAVWGLLTADFVLYHITDRTLFQHLFNK